MVLPVLVLVQSKGIGGILIVINTVLPLLPQFEIVVDVSFNHNVLLGVHSRDFALRVDHQNLTLERNIGNFSVNL